MQKMKVNYGVAVRALSIVFNDYLYHGGMHPLDALALHDGVGDEILRLFQPTWLRGITKETDIFEYARYHAWNALSNGVERFPIEWDYDGEVA